MSETQAKDKPRSLLSSLSGYPFFPCKICQREGFSGKDNDGCDHTVFERARAEHPTLAAHKLTFYGIA